MLHLLRKQLGHDAHPLVQFLKYGIAGGLSTATHITTFFLCGWFFLPCLTQEDITVKLLGLTAPALSEARTSPARCSSITPCASS